MTSYRGRIFRDLVIAVLAGVVLLGIAALVAAQLHFPFSRGFPFTYIRVDDSSPNSYPGRLSYPYDPFFFGLDYLFWVAIAFVFVSALDLGLTRFAILRRK